MSLDVSFEKVTHFPVVTCLSGIANTIYVALKACIRYMWC